MYNIGMERDKLIKLLRKYKGFVVSEDDIVATITDRGIDYGVSGKNGTSHVHSFLFEQLTERVMLGIVEKIQKSYC
jgi:hypothetical protein